LKFVRRTASSSAAFLLVLHPAMLRDEAHENKDRLDVGERIGERKTAGK
jgi:hypothetical protein